MKTILLIMALIMGTSVVAQAYPLINSYRHKPCSSWRINGTCGYNDLSRYGAEARSVQRAVKHLSKRIDELEDKLDFLDKENSDLKEQLNNQR